MARSGIAIVGMSACFADCFSPWEFWDNLKSGRESIGANSRFDAAAAAAGTGHWVWADSDHNNDELFDAGLFGLSPREAGRMEPQHRVLLESAWEALEDGGCSPQAVGPRIGVFAGGNFTSYYSLTPDSHMPEVLDEMIGADKDYLATRVAHHLGLQGPAFTVQSACSTSLVAIHLACQALKAGECDAALAGGVSITKPRMQRYFYSPGGILSPDGFCRAFDADALGTVFTEGVGTIALMRLDEALAGRHPIYAVIRGSAVNNDGGGKTSYMAPSIAGQERVIREALKAARVEPEAVSYVEAHGTATVLGDAIELAALTRVFRGQTDKVGFCQLGSVKSNIGHTVSAAGVAGLIKTALALAHEHLPPNVNFRRPNPDLDVETSPFFVSAEARAWPRVKGAPRIAGVSSFGVGGTNAHAILAEAPARTRARAKRSHYVLTLSAASDAALSVAADRLRQRLKGASRRDLADVAYTLNVGRRALNHRAAIVCADVREAREALAGRAQSTAFSGRIPPGSRTVGFLFPGQGAQYVGMGRQLYAQEPEFRSTIDRCLATLSDDHGLDLCAVFGGTGDAPDETVITRTEIAQPLIFMVEYALGQMLVDWGIKPAYAMGHSVGEYAAAALAGVFDLRDALTLVVHRGRLMQAMASGAMLSVAAPLEALTPLLPDDLDLAAVNGPRQCVVSGSAERIDGFAADLMREQIHSVRLRTSHAFHSRMMEPMLEAFRRVAEGVRPRAPSFPLVSNETGAVAPWEMLRDPDYWVRHVRAPVRFADGAQTLAGSGVDLLLEVGPGRQLSGLAQQCGLHRQGVRIINTLHNDGVAAAEESTLMRALSRTWLEGGEIDWAAVHRHERRQMAHLPPYPFERDRFATPTQTLGPAKSKGRRPVDEWFYVPTWKRGTLPPATAETGAGGCWLTFEGEALGGAAARGLREQGQTVASVRQGRRFAQDGLDFVVNPTSEADFRSLFAALKSAGLTPRRVLHGWTLDLSDEQSRAGDRSQAEHLGLQVLAQILKGYEEAFGRDMIVIDIAVSGAHEVTGAERLSQAGALVVGFAKAAPQEKVPLSCRLIDLDPALLDAGGELAARRLVPALLAETDRVIALRGGFWWLPDYDLTPVAKDATPRLKAGGVYLITGGMGHIGMTLARRLARDWQARLVLIGRSRIDAPPEVGATAPSREAQLEELRALGGEPIYLQGDASNVADLLRVRNAVVKQFGRIDGIVLGAGSVEAPGGADLLNGFELYTENFRGKIGGVKAALHVFGDDPLDFAVVLSSISVVLGGMGLSAYAAANHAADLLVLNHRRRGRTQWVTSNWDLWVGGKIPEDHPRMTRFIGIAIRPEEGAEAIVNLLSMPASVGQAIVSTVDLEQRIDIWIRGIIEAEATQIAQHKRPILATTFAAPEGDLEERLARLWSQVLGIDPIGRDDDFFEMGGHSLLAVQVAVRLQDFVPADAPSANLYETPTLRGLAAALERRAGPTATPAAGAEAVG